LGPDKKKEKIQKNQKVYINKKSKNDSYEKRMLEPHKIVRNWLRRFRNIKFEI